MQKLLLVYYHSENRATNQIWKVLPNMVFPPIWGEKMAAFWACVCKLSWTLLSPARVQPLHGAGRKESSGTGLAWLIKGLLHKLWWTCLDFRQEPITRSLQLPHILCHGVFTDRSIFSLIVWFYQVSWQCKLATVKRFESWRFER